MTWNQTPEHQLLTAIRQGGQARDEALQRIYLAPAVRECVERVLSQGGGPQEEETPFLQDCLVFFDRWVRLSPIDLNKEQQTLTDLMERVAKFLWSKKIARDAELRTRVIRFVVDDPDLRQMIIKRIGAEAGSPEAGQDAYQDGAIVMQEALARGSYRGGAIKGYFRQICYNQWRNRRKSKPGHEPITEEPEDLQLLYDQHEGSEIRQKLAGAFCQLSPRCQEVILLKYFVSETLANPDIADRMGLKNAQNAANLLSRCRDRLWDLYAGKDSDDEQ